MSDDQRKRFEELQPKGTIVARFSFFPFAYCDCALQDKWLGWQARESEVEEAYKRGMLRAAEIVDTNPFSHPRVVAKIIREAALSSEAGDKKG